MRKYYKRHQPCPACGSSDALSVYVDGSTFCFSCRKATKATGATYNPEVVKESPKTKAQLAFLSQERYSPGDIRGLHEQTRRHYHYCDFTQPDGTSYHYYKAGDGAYKLRYTARKYEPCKDFQWVGSLKEQTLFGMSSFTPSGEKEVYVTEGEIDAMSVWQLYQIPAVSIVNGAGHVGGIASSIDYLAGFGTINIMFDRDEVGQERARAVARALRKTTTTPVNIRQAPDGFKDINEFLMTITRE